MWGAQKSDEKSYSIPYTKNRFRSVGVGESEIVNMDLYPNRWVLVNRMEVPETVDM